MRDLMGRQDVIGARHEQERREPDIAAGSRFETVGVACLLVVGIVAGLVGLKLGPGPGSGKLVLAGIVSTGVGAVWLWRARQEIGRALGNVTYTITRAVEGNIHTIMKIAFIGGCTLAVVRALSGDGDCWTEWDIRAASRGYCD